MSPQPPKRQRAGGASPASGLLKLPDSALRRIFAKLDLVSRQRLRLNKRLDAIEKTVPYYLTKIRLTWSRTHISIGRDAYYGKPAEIDFCEAMIEYMERFMSYTVADTAVLKVFARDDLNCVDSRMLSMLLHCNARVHAIIPDLKNRSPDEDPAELDVDVEDDILMPFNGMSDNLLIRMAIRPMRARHLCHIRERMVRGEVRTQHFLMRTVYLDESFIEECFGVTIEEGPVGIVQEVTERVPEIYWFDNNGVIDYVHYDDEWETMTNLNRFSVKRVDQRMDLRDFTLLAIGTRLAPPSKPAPTCNPRALVFRCKPPKHSGPQHQQPSQQQQQQPPQHLQVQRLQQQPPQHVQVQRLQQQQQRQSRQDQQRSGYWQHSSIEPAPRRGHNK